MGKQQWSYNNTACSFVVWQWPCSTSWHSESFTKIKLKGTFRKTTIKILGFTIPSCLCADKKWTSSIGGGFNFLQGHFHDLFRTVRRESPKTCRTGRNSNECISIWCEYLRYVAIVLYIYISCVFMCPLLKSDKIGGILILVPSSIYIIRNKDCNKPF